MKSPIEVRPLEEVLTEELQVEDIIEGKLTHDVNGNIITPPNEFQIKHNAKEREAVLHKIYLVIIRSGIPWEDIIEYVDSNPATTGDRVQAHRKRNADIRTKRNNLRKGDEALRRG